MAKRLLPIQLTQGMDQSADPSALPQGSLVEAVNVRPTRIAGDRGHVGLGAAGSAPNMNWLTISYAGDL